MIQFQSSEILQADESRQNNGPHRTPNPVALRAWFDRSD
jgi:hypothetical protein